MRFAVTAHVRHRETPYDALLARGYDSTGHSGGGGASCVAAVGSTAVIGHARGPHNLPQPTPEITLRYGFRTRRSARVREKKSCPQFASLTDEQKSVLTPSIATHMTTLMVTPLQAEVDPLVHAWARLGLRAVREGIGRLPAVTFPDLHIATLLELELAERLATLDVHINHRATRASVTVQLTRAGFERLSVTTDACRMRFADGSSFLRHAFVRLAFLPAWTSVVPPEAVERTFTELERRLNVVAAERGELALTIPMACVEASARPDCPA